MIGDSLANGEEVRLAGFGTFAGKNQAARTGRDSQTGEALSIPTSMTPSFMAVTPTRHPVAPDLSAGTAHIR